jgi:transcription elongation factor GreB
MSKAFTKEDEGAAEAVVIPRALDLPAGTRNYLTPAGAARLRAELDRLIALQGKQGGGVISPPEQDRDRVRFGATVHVRDEDDRELSYRIVGVPEADPARGLVSWLSPLARALLGATVGDLVTVRTPGGQHELEIESIAYDGG